MHRIYVDRLSDGRYQARISLRCSDCDDWMQFLGLPEGKVLHGATVSKDKTELIISIGTPATLAEYYAKAIAALNLDGKPKNIVKMLPQVRTPEQQWKKAVGK